MSYVETVRAEASRVEALVREASLADLGAPVAGCPSWTSYDLVTHLGGVHRWATAATRTPPEGQVPAAHEPQGLAPGELADWFAEGAGELVAALDVAPQRECWTLAPPRTVAFWLRRQAHETTIHRWDLETALGRPAELDPVLALDGIDEVVTVMVPRQVRLGRLDRSRGWVRLLVGGRTIDVATGAERDREPIAVLVGDAPTVLLALWGRRAVLAPTVEGDRAALEAFLRGALTP